MTPAARRVLLIGFGNPGRGDDGLGPALAQAVGELGLPGVTVDADYGLAPEHAADVADHEVVIFADADLAGPEPFSFQRLEPRDEMPFSSHGLRPTGVLALAETISGRPAQGYLLAIRGYEFEPFIETLSEGARRNLDLAAAFAVAVLSAKGSTEAAEFRPHHLLWPLNANDEGGS